MSTKVLLMGGAYHARDTTKETPFQGRINPAKYNQKFFRPSCYPTLNNRFQYSFFKPFENKNPSEIVIPKSLMATPEDLIINYFSILREAANFSGDMSGGCGTVGFASIPYPIAFQFFTKDYQKEIDFKTYYESFENIGHINLIKVRLTTCNPKHENHIRYFIELESIEGSNKGITCFAYYYGFMYLKKENDCYKIESFNLEGEDFLCAPYHGWSYDAEMLIDAMYGNWCKLVGKRYPMIQHGDIKQIYFDGTDGYRYLIVFVEVTNGYDIEIAQFRQYPNGNFQPIMFDPLECIDKK